MSLPHAILGFLYDTPNSGYDLKKIFDTSVSHFWPADQSQIYKTLARMQQQGWLQTEVYPQATRPARKVYSITSAGKQELLTWLLTPLPAEPNRSAEMIQVFFAARLTDEQILRVFERAAGLMRQGLAQYDQIPRDFQHYSAYTHSPRQFYFWMLTLEIGVTQLRSNLALIEDIVRRIRAGEIPAE